MKQKFKGMTLSSITASRNIIKVYAGSSNQFVSNNWYAEANKFAVSLSRIYKTDLSVVCGIIAALSPLKRWDENKQLAINVLQGRFTGHTKMMLNKARQIKQSNGDVAVISDILNGNKIISFYLNILNPEQTEAVTIDRHALSVILGRNTTDIEYRGMTLKQYEFFVNCYRIAGAKLGVSPVKLQAITWQAWRDAKGIKDDSGYAEDDSEAVPF